MYRDKWRVLNIFSGRRVEGGLKIVRLTSTKKKKHLSILFEFCLFFFFFGSEGSC